MFLHTIRIVFIVLEVLVLFNLLIAVHELGHFLAARWRGLYIEQFGIWFGKPIWQKKINGVLYSLGSIPLGGFVKLPQLAPMDIIEGEADVDRAKLPTISALDKIIVAIAGPVFSLLLALTFAGIVWVVGHPVSEADMTTTIGYVMKDSPAAKAGLLAGDKVLRVDGKPVRRFTGMIDSVTWNVIRSEGASIPFEVERGGQMISFEVVPYKAETRGWRRKSVRQVLISPAITPIVAKVRPKTPAAATGLKSGDIIRGYNGTPIYSPLALADYIEVNAGKPMVLNVERGGQRLNVPITPVMLPGEKMPRIGIEWDTSGQMSIAHPNPIEQVYNSVSNTLSTIGAVVSPKSDVGLQHMSGPVGIGHVYYLLFESESGWQLAIWFSVLLNVNLAILNMLPIPILDGGHIVLAIVESTRRKPVNMRLLEIIQTSCAVLIFGFILYVTFFDIGDLFGSGREKDKTPASPAKATATPGR
jgi:regulator of sigma E protease